MYLYVHAGLEELAKLPNVFSKVSGVFAVHPNWDQQLFELTAKPIFEIFGIERYKLTNIIP